MRVILPGNPACSWPHDVHITCGNCQAVFILERTDNPQSFEMQADNCTVKHVTVSCPDCAQPVMLSRIFNNQVMPRIDDLLERTAAREHEKWADYMRYFLGNLLSDQEGRLIIPAAYVKALMTLTDTSYHDLSEDQKENDREEARKTLAVINER